MNNTAEAILSTKNLSFGYVESSKVVTKLGDNLHFQIYPEELICLLGRNGSGKTTLLHTLSGLQPTLKGEVYLLNKNIHTISKQEKARLIAIVLTENVYIENYSIFELVSLGRYPYTNSLGQLNKQDQEIIQSSINLVGLDKLKNKNILQVSDGERQKAMIARALAQEPTLLFLDEPTIFLDVVARYELIVLLKNLIQEKKMTIILSTHELDLARKYSDRIFLLDANGNMQTGTPKNLQSQKAFEKLFGNSQLK